MCRWAPIPWYGDPNQILPARHLARAVISRWILGRVIPAPSVNNGMNPLPASMLPPSGLSAADQRSVVCAGAGYGDLQRATAQPVRLHAVPDPDGHLQPAER